MLPVALDARRSLRPVSWCDVDELWALFSSNEEHLAPWLPWARGSQQRERAEKFVIDALAQARRGDGVQLAITQFGRIIGIAGYHYVNRAQCSTSIGYWLHAGAQGRGTMTLAVARLVDHAFGAWELNRVEIRAALHNRRSRAIPERLGFVNEGIMRAGERIGDGFLDLAVYSMLACDWPHAKVVT